MTTDGRLLAFYGDDFTGSTDVLLQYFRAGLRGRLFLTPPTDDEITAAARTHDVVGVAGITRSLRTGAIEAVIRPVFEQFRKLQPLIFQYKVCSTADSSPSVGSFAPAIRAGRAIFGNAPVPVLVAQPSLRRYTAFGHHFAGDADGIHRLDRQPTMANHPVTSMAESDLRLHLGEQLGTVVGGVDLTELHRENGGRSEPARIRAAGREAYVLDSVTDDDILRATGLILETAAPPIFVVGSGGLSAGIAAHVAPTANTDTGGVASVESCLAVSGSASPHSSRQISRAVEAGWRGVYLDPARLGSPAEAMGAVAEASSAAIDGLVTSPGSVVYTAHREQGVSAVPVDVGMVSDALASVVKACLLATDVSRLVVAGGDTCGHVVNRLDATAFSPRAAVTPDLLLGTLASTDQRVDGLEVVLKGGQLGPPDLFEAVRRGVVV